MPAIGGRRYSCWNFGTLGPIMRDLPKWMRGLKPGDWLYDGRPLRFPRDQGLWDNLNWSGAYVDLGPSPAGNLGPYWHVPVIDDQEGRLGSHHRLYPKVLATKWCGLIRQAIDECVTKKMKSELSH